MLGQSYHSFREQAKAWLTLTPPGGHPRVVVWNGMRVLLADSVNCPDGYHLTEALIVRKDFTCGRACRFDRPVYSGGGCQVGKGTRLQAVTAEGRLTLGPAVRVEQWAAGGDILDMRSGAWVGGDASSRKAIRLGPNAGAALLFSPEIASPGATSGLGEAQPMMSFFELPPPAAGTAPDLGLVRGFRPEKLAALGAETWVYDGSLSFPFPLLLRSNLVVRGSFWCPPGSLLEEDVKAGGTLRVGAGSICRGHLVARGDLILDEDCVFQGLLEAAQTLRLSSGVRGFRDGGPVEATAAGRLIVEPDVVVRGRLCSERAVRAESAEPADSLVLLLAQA